MPSTQHTPEPAVFRSEKGAINGVASLDSNGLVPNSQLPGATQSAAGTMSAADKTKLDGIATGATANVVSDSLSDTSTTNALSAAKGKALNDSITALNTQIASLIKYKTFNIGNVSVSSGNYYTAISGNDANLSGYTIIGSKVGWISAGDVFSVFVASTGDVYVSAKNGTSINSLNIVLLYVKNDVVSVAT